MNATNLLDCGHPIGDHSAFVAGYGTDSKTKETRCYDCCADFERQTMVETGKAFLYLIHRPDGQLSEITDWPGHLRFPVFGKVRRG